MSKPYLINIVGPTAIGKTSKSIALAQHFSSEILSADSRQFYKEMCIGTAVPTPEELAAAPHHFIQHVSVSEQYSVGDFEKDAFKKLDELFEKHKILFLVGGSGLYVDAVNKGLDHFPKVEASIREKLNVQVQEHGLASLQLQLKELDPDHYKKVALSNPQRVIRALEICLGTGKPYSSFLNHSAKERNFNSIKIGLEAPRPLIYERIEKRVDFMLENGLLEEAKELYPLRELNALNTVGYKELFQYFDGTWSLEFALSEIKKNTRRFAKRQLTWFRRDEHTFWFPYDAAPQEIADFITQKVD
ncbi:tRNA (adenosine(37)-N6)-dimethylallyltransferase MiaA [Mesonia sp. MT50]|uniref:tRNA dimethylallyltransferase n=1 Tax=Mesonia profundi TaxID=3070998 RepID=A0ABU0ZZK4_9FLAO|nr:tRNA (adenosine(37)-N6)-dimethylallyltransferase MiaA [Mesonia profundi]MDQ7916431.1 tRNA (adenosine(37)-N6)-dimethylallyltransferase MiaA [Mesonia profundi]